MSSNHAQEPCIRTVEHEPKMTKASGEEVTPMKKDHEKASPPLGRDDRPSGVPRFLSRVLSLPSRSGYRRAFHALPGGLCVFPPYSIAPILKSTRTHPGRGYPATFFFSPFYDTPASLTAMHDEFPLNPSPRHRLSASLCTLSASCPLSSGTSPSTP